MKCLWCEDPIEKLFENEQFCDKDCRECYYIVEVDGQCNQCGAVIIGYHDCQGVPGEEEKGGEG